MLLNWCCSLNIFNAEKLVGGDVKKSNLLTVNLYSLKLKFQTVAEKTAKNFRGLLYFAAPGT